MPPPKPAPVPLTKASLLSPDRLVNRASGPEEHFPFEAEERMEEEVCDHSGEKQFSDADSANLSLHAGLLNAAKAGGSGDNDAVSPLMERRADSILKK